MKNTCDFPAFIASRIQDNFIHIEMKKIKKLTSSDVAQMYECFRRGGDGKGVFALVSFKGYIPMSDDAMAEARKPENQKHVRATAYVIRSAAFRVAIKFFMNFSKPKHPLNIFGTKIAALAWLEQMQKEIA